MDTISSSDGEFLANLEGLPPRERAAAIGHRIYVMTAKRAAWTLRVAEEWNDLSEESRRYNEELVPDLQDVLASESELLCP